MTAKPARTALGIVFMRLRVAEIGKDAVAHICKPGQNFGDRAMIRAP